MADKKISALTGASTPLAGTEVVPIVQSGATVKAAVTSFTNGLALTPTSVTLAAGNLVLNGGLTSDVALIKNTGQSFGVATDRWIGSDGTTSTWFFNVPTGGSHFFAVNNINKLTVVGDNVNIPVGNLVIGTSGKGIDFSATPDTGTSELLADYEEGTFTPTTSGFVEVLGGGTVTYSGTYTKVGRLVKVTIRIITTGAATVAAAGGATAALSLPFAPSVTDSGTWANTAAFTTSGAVTVNTNQNMYVVDSWTAANASWTLQATYAV